MRKKGKFGAGDGPRIVKFSREVKRRRCNRPLERGMYGIQAGVYYYCTEDHLLKYVQPETDVEAEGK